MREMDRRVGILRLLLADIADRERQAEEARKQLHGQLQRIVDFTVQYNGGVSNALAGMAEVEGSLPTTGGLTAPPRPPARARPRRAARPHRHARHRRGPAPPRRAGNHARPVVVRLAGRRRAHARSPAGWHPSARRHAEPRRDRRRDPQPARRYRGRQRRRGPLPRQRRHRPARQLERPESSPMAARRPGEPMRADRDVRDSAHRSPRWLRDFPSARHAHPNAHQLTRTNGRGSLRNSGAREAHRAPRQPAGSFPTTKGITTAGLASPWLRPLVAYIAARIPSPALR